MKRPETHEGIASLRKFLRENPKYVVYDYSSVSKYEECHAKYNYVYNHWLRDSESVAALFSSMLIHPPLANWYLSGGRRPWVPPEWQSGWDLFQAAVSSLPTTRRDALYTLTVDQRLVISYTELFRRDFETYKVLSTERVYWSVFPGAENALWVTKPDLLLERADKERITFDFKTSLYDFNAHLVDFDRQFLGQAYGTGAKHVCKAFMRIPTAYNEMLINREILPIDEELLNEWFVEMGQTIMEIQRARETGVWVKQAPAGCTAYNRMCVFIDLCKLGKTREGMIDIAEKRHPFTYLGLGGSEQESPNEES